MQEASDRCYDEGAYDLVVDYMEEPDPPLYAHDAAWADDVLRRRGLRESASRE